MANDKLQLSRDPMLVKIGRILPLGYVATEVENYLGRHRYDDGVLFAKRVTETRTESEYGLLVAFAETLAGRLFNVFYNARFNEFGLIDADAKQVVHVWGVVTEDTDTDCWNADDPA